MKTISELLAAQRELTAKMANAEGDVLATLEREYAANKREIELLNQESIAREHAPKADVKGIVAQVREAMKSNKKDFTINAGVESREAIVKNVHTTDVELQGLLEPLYTNSVLSKLGARFYTGMPQGDIQIPVMGKGTVGWATEVAAAAAAGQTFSHVTLQPKRLTAYVDVSKAFLLADTIGAEAAIRRDLINAINDKLEATIFGYAAEVSGTSPAGMFNGKTLEDATTFAKVCGIEAGVEENCVSGEMKYLLSPKAKADLRAMAKSAKNTQLVLEDGTVDGVPALVSANVKDAAATTKGCYIYGNWSNLAVGVWGSIDITVDEFSQAVNGCVRLVVNAYVDSKVLRDAAFAFGNTRA